MRVTFFIVHILLSSTALNAAEIISGPPAWKGISQEALSAYAKEEFSAFQKNELQAVVTKEKEAYIFAALDHVAVNPPVGRWALLRSGKRLCAIKFNSFWRSHTDDSNFYYSHEDFFSKYD